MGVVPTTSLGKIEFYENHNTPFSSNAVAIGTTAAEVTALNTKTVAARAAYNAQQSAQAAAKAATLNLKTAVNAMAQAGSEILKEIKAKAGTAGDNVYVLAQIPAPATPSPVGPPGTPTDFKVTLLQDGSVKLIWKCANPTGSTGTIYQVYRKLGTAADFQFVGGVGIKEFQDTTIPAGTMSVVYQITAVRSTSIGEPAQFNVNFGAGGVGGGGELTAAVVPSSPRIAA